MWSTRGSIKMSSRGGPVASYRRPLGGYYGGHSCVHSLRTKQSGSGSPSCRCGALRELASRLCRPLPNLWRWTKRCLTKSFRMLSGSGACGFLGGLVWTLQDGSARGCADRCRNGWEGSGAQGGYGTESGTCGTLSDSGNTEFCSVFGRAACDAAGWGSGTRPDGAVAAVGGRDAGLKASCWTGAGPRRGAVSLQPRFNF